MDSLCFVIPTLAAPNLDLIRNSKIHTRTLTFGSSPAFSFHVHSRFRNHRFISTRTAHCSSNHRIDGEEESQGSVEEIRVPEDWLNSSRAVEESEWLRVTLLKWLDEEYCPEPTNIEISNVAARSYYKSLMENQTDLGDILLSMAMNLESVSYQESFHGAFSSANAAVSLILQRIVG